MLALRRTDGGSILIIAIVLVVVIMGMAGSYLVISNVQSHRVSEQVESDRARTAAEDGIDHMRTYLLSLVDTDSADPASQWDSVLATSGGTPDWADSVETTEGSYTVRLLDNDDGDGNLLDDLDGTVLMEAVGYGTKQGARGTAHVIRCIVVLEVNDPTDNFAIITGGNLEIFGNEIVDGSLGNVHTNANLTLQGSASIAHDATASGTTTVVGDAATVGDDLLANEAIVPIAPVVPADYRPYANFILTSDGRVLDGTTGVELFNFTPTVSSLPSARGDRRVAVLPDGRMTLYGSGFGMPNDRNSNNGYGNSGGGVSGGTPPGQTDTTTTGDGSTTTTTGDGSTTTTTGDGSTTTGGTTTTTTTGDGSTTTSPGNSGGSDGTTGPPADNGGGNQSLSYNGFTWSSTNGWSTETSGWVDGMYYVEGDITFNHGGTADAPWDVTIVAEGSISTQGNPYLNPFFNDSELFVAGEDVYMRGTGSNSVVEGLILAHEQVSLDGNITFSGRIVAESGVNVDGSQVDINSDPLGSDFGGSVHVTYNGYMPRSFVSEYRLPVRSWQEDVPSNSDIQTLGNNTQVLNTLDGGGTTTYTPQ
mgnify:FL=1